MKELETHSPVEVKDEKHQEKKQLYLGSKVLKRGHSLWEINTSTIETKLAKFEEVNADSVSALKGGISGHRKCLINEGCMYFSALNKKNAQKHFFKYLDSIVK